MNPVPLFLIIVTLPLLLVGCGEKPVAETKPPEIEKEELPPIPDKVTKEFVMNMWNQPNNETDIIKEIKAYAGKTGIWTASIKIGENKDELVNNQKAKRILKYFNKRYALWKVTSTTNITSYSAITYDFEKQKYYWWEFGEEAGVEVAAEYSGKLLDGNLIEWESVIYPLGGAKIILKEISKTAERIVMTGELLKDGQIIMAVKDISSWSEELPTSKNKP